MARKLQIGGRVVFAAPETPRSPGTPQAVANVEAKRLFVAVVAPSESGELTPSELVLELVSVKVKDSEVWALQPTADSGVQLSLRAQVPARPGVRAESTRPTPSAKPQPRGLEEVISDRLNDLGGQTADEREA